DVAITLQGSGDKRITDSFAGVSLEDGIQRLARGCNVVLMYSGPGDGRLAEMHVYDARVSDTGSASLQAADSNPSAVVDVKEERRAAQLQALRDLTQKANERQPEAVTRLIEMLERDEDPVVRQSAANSLGAIPGPETAQALTTALGDEDASVRAGVLSSLGKM